MESEDINGDDTRRAESEIGGNERALQALRELIVFPFRYPLEARTLGLKWSRGLLLDGPPGTGKVDSSTALEFFFFRQKVCWVHQSCILSSKCVGFIKAMNLCIEESKMFVLLRSSLHSWTQTSLHHLHQELLVDAIDPALRRAGRFDTLVEVSTPNEEDRFKILLLYTKKLSLDPSVDLQAIATSCNGYVGADLEALCREATMCASKRSADSLILTLQDFKVAKSVVGPSLTRGITVDIPKVTWDDVGGLKDLKKKLQQAVEWPIKHSAAFTKMGISPMRGILLHGPPGCSKTTLAKAAANAAQASFFSLSCAELFSMYVGEGEALLRNMFQRARLAAPSIIFFDEADVVACKRGEEGSSSNSSTVGERLLSTLLTEMDGLEEAKGILVLAATNRPYAIDAALMRPGRFDLLG
ncbi:cell division control protein 48 homolog B-like isoform X4 [Brassica napus]|uniref:cell division control protein 48 homolog B-like isoform X4 n=1 Tax=Brassica napus TaxID=3708 RepID=UPI0020791B93|nr:cell division control protein 48 homolog B-like isoform X4 [Brassica napus]